MLTYLFHFSQFNNLSNFSKKTQVWLNLYPEYIIKIIIKIIGYFWGVTRCVPKTEQGGIMEKCHASPYGGHFAEDKTT